MGYEDEEEKDGEEYRGGLVCIVRIIGYSHR